MKLRKQIALNSLLKTRYDPERICIVDIVTEGAGSRLMLGSGSLTGAQGISRVRGLPKEGNLKH
jgi:hypothetical protein